VTVGLLHPGAMGVTIGASCRDAVIWCSQDRSGATRARAERAGFEETAELGRLVELSEIIVSVCPPSEAVAVADAVATIGFDGIYVDANAIAPSTARSIGDRFERFVDGGIIGPPARAAGTTRWYLAGDDAVAIAARWGPPIDVRVIDGGAGAASALKMAYAMWTKISAALLLDVRALARLEGVEDALLAEWAISQPATTSRSESTAQGVAPKAWRFAGEMDEMVVTADDAGLPPGFAEAAAEVYRRLADLKDTEVPTLDEVLARLCREAPGRAVPESN
jgi:3-hydroxyisobutyrate dehydrogenase-like beta-hydroxyacid dehydrogenase